MYGKMTRVEMTSATGVLGHDDTVRGIGSFTLSYDMEEKTMLKHALMDSFSNRYFLNFLQALMRCAIPFFTPKNSIFLIDTIALI